jgi:uncharacterized protein (TIGR00251 family)
MQVMRPDWCTEVANGVRLSVRITPNAKKSEVQGVVDDALKIKLHAQPIEGKANEALIAFIADKLGLPKRAVQITHGQLNRHKLLEIQGSDLTVDAVKRLLL